MSVEKDEVAASSDEDCPICLNTLAGTVVKLSCSHTFHRRPCLMAWREKNDTCPMCRRSIELPEEDKEAPEAEQKLSASALSLLQESLLDLSQTKRSNDLRDAERQLIQDMIQLRVTNVALPNGTFVTLQKHQVRKPWNIHRITQAFMAYQGPRDPQQFMSFLRNFEKADSQETVRLCMRRRAPSSVQFS